MTRLWHAVAPAFALLAFAAFAFALTGCTARPMVCTLVKIDGEPALGCVDASAVSGSEIRPYSPAPAPEIFEPDTKPGIRPWSEKHGIWTEKENL